MVLTKVKSKLAFTLVELVVTIAIIGVLAGILIPSVFGYVKMAKMEGLNNNARTVFLAAQNYLTSWTGDGNDAATVDPDAATVDLNKILPAVSEKEKAENGGSIKHLALARTETDEQKRENKLYQILSNYISDQLLLEKSILLEYNGKTGKVRSAFVSEEPFLDYSGENSDPTNVNDREENALWEKEQGYYGVDYTGSLPERTADQTLSVRIVNSGGMLRVECDIADYLTVKGNAQYEFHVFSLENPEKGYTFIFDPNSKTDQTSAGGTVWAVKYTNAKTAIEKADPAKPMVYETNIDPDGTGHIVWILDVFSEWNAYNSKKDMSIAACYPNLPVGMLDAEVTAKAADTGAEIAAEQSENMEHSYFAGQEKEADGSFTYMVRDARQLNNVRYMTNEKGAVKGAFKQMGDVSMRAFYDKEGDRVLAEGARVTIAPLGVLAGAYDAENERASAGGGGYKITELMVASASGPAGLFTENRGSIENLTVESAQIGSENVPVKTWGGILAGTNADTGVIQNCSVSGSVTGGTAAGGVAGVNNGHIKYCRSGVFPAPGTANAAGYAYDNTCRYTEKVLKGLKPVSVEREFPCMISSGRHGEKNPAVGGIAGMNTRVVTECVNISQVEIPYGTGGGSAGGLVGQNAAGAQVYQSYNAGRVASSANGSSVGGVAGINDGGIVYQCYNTGRVNLKNDPENNYGNDVPLANGNMGGVIGYNRETGQAAECYAINYIGYPKDGVPGTAAGGIIGRDDTTNGDLVSDCCFLAAENMTAPVGVSALPGQDSLHAVYDPDDLAYYFTDDPWHTDDPALQGTFYYPYPYLEELASRQCTPWEQIVPATPTLAVRIQNGELLTAEWTNETSTVQKGISVELVNGNGDTLDTIKGVDLGTLRGITSVRAALQTPLTGTSGREYPVFYEDNTYKIVLDGVLMDGLQNTIQNYFRDQQSIGVRVTYPGEEPAVSNLENPLYAGTSDEGNEVANARHLYNVRYHTDQDFVQTGSVELHNFDGSEATIAPAGMLGGSYDGSGYAIRNLSIQSVLGDAGLFAQIGPGAAVTDLVFENVAVDGSNGMASGAVAGTNTGAVSNITVKSGSVNARQNAGAAVGVNAGTVSHCTTGEAGTGTRNVQIVSGQGGFPKNIGGMVGLNAGEIAPGGLSTTTGRTTSGNQWLGGTATYTLNQPLQKDENGYVYIRFNSSAAQRGRWKVRVKAGNITYDCYYFSFIFDFAMRENRLPASVSSDGLQNYVRFRVDGTELWYDGVVSSADTDSPVIGREYTPIVPDAGYANGYDGVHANSKMTYQVDGAPVAAADGTVYIAFDDLAHTEFDSNDFKKSPLVLKNRQTGEEYPLLDASGSALTINGLDAQGSGYFYRFEDAGGGRYRLKDASATDALGFIKSPYLGTVTDCTNLASLAGGQASGRDDRIGGIAGTNGGRIIHCINGTLPTEPVNATVLEGGAALRTGGVAGENGGVLQYSVNAAQVRSTGAGAYTGGLAAVNTNVIEESYNAGTVQAEGESSNAGGVVGQNDDTVRNVYNTGRINVLQESVTSIAVTDGNAGGVVAYNAGSGTVKNCYNIGFVGDVQAGAAGGVIGKNDNTDPAGAELANLYSLVSAALNHDVIGDGVPAALAALNAGISKDELTAKRSALGVAFAQQDSAYPGEFDYPYPYLENAPHCTEWEDATVLRQGDGTSWENAFLIGTPDQLRAVEELDRQYYAEHQTGAYFKQIADIDLGGAAFGGIDLFRGQYDGQEHTISNMSVPATQSSSSTAETHAAMIAKLDQGSLVKNVVLEDVSITGSYSAPTAGNDRRLCVAGIAGVNVGRIENCSVSGTVRAVVSNGAPEVYAGGIAAYNYGQVSACSNMADISVQITGKKAPAAFLGGILGANDGEVSNSRNAGAVFASGSGSQYLGGIVGDNLGSLLSSYNVGDLTADGGSAYLGGLAGHNWGSISYCIYLSGKAGVGDGTSPQSSQDYAAVQLGSADPQVQGQVLSVLNPSGGLWKYNQESGYPYPVYNYANILAYTFLQPAETPSSPEPEEDASPSPAETTEPDPSVQPDREEAQDSAAPEQAQTGGEAA